MDILHVCQLYWPANSGAGRYFAEVGERLAAEGHRVTVLATDAHDLEHLWLPGKRRFNRAEEQRNGVRIVRLPIHRAVGSTILYPVVRRGMVELSRLPGSDAALRRLAQITPQLPGLRAFLARERFDLVHGTNITLDFALLPVWREARRRGVPLILTPFVHLGEPEHDTIRRYYTMRHQIELMRQSNAVIVQGETERRYLAGRGIAGARLRQIGVGVTPADLTGGDGTRFRSEHRVSAPLVVYVGAMAYDKGTTHLVEAMQRLWHAGAEARLALLGAPLEHFSRLLDGLSAADRERIIVVPYASEQQKNDALAAADLFAMPSRTDSFGIVYLEAWCYRVPVIGALAGGVPDVIDDGENGALVRFGDVAGLAATIAQLLGDATERRRLGANGHAKVLRRYTWDGVYRRVREVYGEVTAAQ